MIYLNTWNLKMQWFLKKLDWKFAGEYMIKQKLSSYAYELELSSEMKIHSVFHVSLLLFSKHDSMIRQLAREVLLLLFMIVENEEGPYFVDSIDDMKWNMKSAWFELLIKWEGYKQQTWEFYTQIKTDTSILMKEFHEDHPSWSAPAEWVQDDNKRLSLDTWTWTMKAGNENMNVNKITPQYMTRITQNWKFWESSI